MPITPLPTPYPQRGQRATFADRLDAFIAWLIGAPAQFDALAASLNVLAAGSANKMAYTIDLSSTAMADPGAGKLRFNSATQNAATALALDLVGADSNDYTGLIGTFSASSSLVLGTLRLEKAADPTKFLVFNVTAVTAPSGYRQLGVVCTASSTTNPFAASDLVLLSFTRNGDKGDVGPAYAAPYMKVSERQSVGSNSFMNFSVSNIRQFNTIESNSISGASLASYGVTIPAGTYRCFARAPGRGVGLHKVYLYTTDGTTLLIGSNADAPTTNTIQTDSEMRGEFTIAASKTIQVRHAVTSTSGTGGAAVNNTQPEVYAELELMKVA